MKRVLDIARIQMVNKATLVGWPVGILGLVFAANYAIFLMIGSGASPEGRITGGLMSIYAVVAITHLQTMTQMFGFVLGLGATRRAFFQATALIVGVQAALFGLLLTVLGELERVTGGWGIGLQFIRLPFLAESNPLLQWLVYTVPFVALSALGVFVGVLFKRWGQTGMFVLSAATLLVFAALALLITWQGWWGAIGSFFATTSTAALLAGYPLIPAAILAAAGFLVLRRATP